MASIFYLKKNDTRPVLEVVLLDPDGTPHDLTGYTAIKLWIKLNDGTVISRPMSPVGDLTTGRVRYAWQDTDWDTGGLIAGPEPPYKPSDDEHTMEYEVVTATSRTTFPNDDWDILRILPDLGGEAS
jgi:hypothetical protein